MTAPPQVNGHKSPAMPIVWDWRPVEQPEPPAQEQPEVPPTPHTEPAAPAVDYVALAEAETIRKRAEAEADALRIEAEGKAAAAVAKAEVEAEKQRIANERAAMALEEKRAEHEARMAETNRKREETERQTAEARKADEAQQEEVNKKASEVAAADAKWRKYAINFAIVCGIVALPVQMNAFWNPEAWWLVAAPVMLEGGSWVVQRGAAAAVANRRPLWHYRIIAWLLALIAAGINLWHGWNAFDPATAIATAFASVAGPGVWDLHEHGRIRKRDGVLSWKERSAQKKAAAAEEAAKTAAVRFQAEREAHREDAVRRAADELAAERSQYFPTVWEHAQKLAAALGETAVTEAVWRRAHRDIEGTDPGDSVDIIHGRNSAKRRLESALTGTPVNRLNKVKTSQAASQMPPSPKGRRYNPPAVSGIRRKGDTPKYVAAARKQAAITARITATEEQK